jgi:5'-deoxynucleotidase YfbR-like HD superfamily hydrolase
MMSAWIQTYSGVAFDLMDPQPDQVKIEDISHALAQLCRFAGHTQQFYSVAQHSVLVSRSVPVPLALAGLLHDATEAYCVDVPRPLKRMPGMEGYRAVEQRIWQAVASRFGLADELPFLVKEADNRMLFTERRDLMGPCEREWECVGEPQTERIFAWPARAAERLFLCEFEMLTAKGITA